MNLREAAEMALEALDILLTEPMAKTAADKAEQLLLLAAPALRQALAQPEQGNSSPNYPNTESNTPFVDIVNMSQEHVDKTAKSKHEPWCDSVTKLLLSLPPQIPPCNCKPRREWVGLKDADIAETMRGNVEGSNMLPYSFARAIEAKLKEKNT